MNEILALAAQLYTHAVEMAERPITGHFKEYAELNERWVSNSREHLHLFLKLNAEVLDEEWTEILQATETSEAWLDMEWKEILQATETPEAWETYLS